MMLSNGWCYVISDGDYYVNQMATNDASYFIMGKLNDKSSSLLGNGWLLMFALQGWRYFGSWRHCLELWQTLAARQEGSLSE